MNFITTVVGYVAIVQSHAIFSSGAILGALGIALIKSGVK